MASQILLIDDSALQLRIREQVLRQAGFLVHIATTGEGALALLRTQSVGESLGAVVTDHVMPDLSGAELVRAIRTIRPGIPVVVVTGMPGADAEYEGLEIDFRQKPVNPDELIALLRSRVGDAAA